MCIFSAYLLALLSKKGRNFSWWPTTTTLLRLVTDIWRRCLCSIGSSTITASAEFPSKVAQRRLWRVGQCTWTCLVRRIWPQALLSIACHAEKLRGASSQLLSIRIRCCNGLLSKEPGSSAIELSFARGKSDS